MIVTPSIPIIAPLAPSARDLIGVKPLWYAHDDTFAFASEKKALEKLGYSNVIELNPRKILCYDIKEKKISFESRKFFSLTPVIKKNIDIEKLLTAAIEKRIPQKKFGILFSGGIDSTVLAYIAKRLGCNFTCYTAALVEPGLKEPHDLIAAKKVAKRYGFKLKIVSLPLRKVPEYLKKVVPLIEDTSVVKVGVALTFYVACEQAKKDGCKAIFSGLGSEEIFGGYQRHKESSDINKECILGLMKMYERDTYRDDVVSMYHGLELRVPFLDKELVSYSLRIPSANKINGDRDKIILRETGKRIGLDLEDTERQKKAAQYGSNFDKAIRKLTKKAGFKYRSDYLRRFYPSHNLKLGVLFSSGKDSNYALYLMKRQKYDISCLITLRSKNPDSYMFHTPAIDLAELQAKSLDIPLMISETKGEEEKELDDLKTAIKNAKTQFGIEGIVTGALYSTYQRDRIEKICDKLGLKTFSPLWHIDQEEEMRQLLELGFKFMMTSVAAEGFDKSWIGKIISSKDIDRLSALNKKIGINIAGEGGEYESLVVDSPIYSKRIVIKDKEIVAESTNTARMTVKKASLWKKI